MAERADVSTGVSIAFDHAGAGGFPLLLIHGWPETRRIWSRNVGALAEVGFEVIAPDLRGFGDSGLAPDDRYDAAAHARDMQALLEHLGHDRCVVSAGDLGGVVAQDLSLRFDGLVERMVLFNTIAPFLPAEYEAAGLGATPAVNPQTSDYFVRQSQGRRRPGRRAGQPRAPARVRGADVRPAAVGRRRMRSRRRRSRGWPSRSATPNPSVPRSPTTSTWAGRAPRRNGRGCSSATRPRRWCCTAPRTT